MPKLPGVSQKDAVRVSHRQNFESYSECPLGIASPLLSLFTTFVRFADPKIQKLLRDLHL